MLSLYLFCLLGFRPFKLDLFVLKFINNLIKFHLHQLINSTSRLINRLSQKHLVHKRRTTALPSQLVLEHVRLV